MSCASCKNKGVLTLALLVLVSAMVRLPAAAFQSGGTPFEVIDTSNPVGKGQPNQPIARSRLGGRP